MAVALIAWGRFFDPQGNKITVPAPSTDPEKPWLADFLREEAPILAQTFDIIQWPPLSKAQGGAGAGSDGYGLFDRRDLGAKPQQGSTPTRYGTLESVLAAIAALNAHGVQSYGDLVLHQLIGENAGPGQFRYLGADMRTLNGRGGTTPGWFRGNTGNADPIPPFRPEDDVPSPADDTSFGRELSYQHCHPAHVTTEDALDFLHWLVARTGLAGFRFDDTKGTYAPAVAEIMNSTDLPFYAEFFDGNPANLNWWATSNPLNSRSAVQDFTLHFALQNACNTFTATPLINNSGYWQWRPDLAATFVDNPDTDTSPGQQVVSNKALAYAFLLTIPARLTLIYGKDYFPSTVWPGAYGLHPLLDNLCWINRTFAFGRCETRFADPTTLVLSRDGDGGPIGWSGGLLTALNFSTLNPRTLTCQTPFGPNRWLHDYTGHHPDISTDSTGQATFTIPSNYFGGGQSYLCFAPAGVSHPVPSTPRQTTQTFIGDPTLDVLPARNGTLTLPQRLHIAPNTPIRIELHANQAAWRAASEIIATLTGPTGRSAAKLTLRKGLQPATTTGQTQAPGWHTLTLTSAALPATGSNFRLTVTYTGAA